VKRREFIALVGVAATWPVEARAQQKVYRIGFLFAGTIALRPPVREFWKALQELGYVEGNNLIVEIREARGEVTRLPKLASELVARHPDVIVAVTNAAVAAAKNATQSIPIVMAIARDPLLHVKSLARPEANVTGTASTISTEIVGKRMQLLNDIISHRSLIGLIWNSEYEALGLVAVAEQMAKSMGNETVSLPFQGPGQLKDVLDKLLENHVGAVVLMSDPVEFDRRRDIIDFLAANRIPAMHPWPEEAEDGGLAAYGSRLSDEYRRPAYYVDKILKGAKPSDLPIEQPTKFEFIINLKSAKALGLSISNQMQMLADAVIE
jgi:putative ABC transport system substrate-binding protein